jgi:hypothetical protein
MLGVYPPHNIRSIIRSTLQLARRTAAQVEHPIIPSVDRVCRIRSHRGDVLAV